MISKSLPERRLWLRSERSDERAMHLGASKWVKWRPCSTWNIDREQQRTGAELTGYALNPTGETQAGTTDPRSTWNTRSGRPKRLDSDCREVRISWQSSLLTSPMNFSK